MSWFRMPLFPWSLYATGWIQVLATPILAITLVLIMLERIAGIGIFDPAKGGDPLLYQHLFWIYSHPAVYIMILPAMGAITEILPTFARRTIFGYKAIAFSSMAIAAVGSLVWAHHMFTSGMSPFANMLFSLLTMVVAVPSAIKVFNWTATLYKGSIDFQPPLLFALTFIFLFSIGGLTGVMQGALAVNVHVHDTYFIVGHFHYVMFGGTGFGFFAALLYWFPKMFGRMYSKRAAYIAWLPDVHRVQHALLHHAGAGPPGHAAALLQPPAHVQHRPRHSHRRLLDPGRGPDHLLRQLRGGRVPGRQGRRPIPGAA